MSVALPQGAFLIAIANEIDIQVGVAIATFPDRAAEFERISANTKIMREKAALIADATLQDIPDAELIEIRDLLTSTIDMAKAFGQDGQRLQ